LPKIFGSLGHHITSHYEKPFIKKISDVLRRRGLGQEFFMSEAVGFYEHEKKTILSQSFKAYAHANNLDSFSLVQPYYERIRSHIRNPTFLQIMSYIELSLRLPELLLMRADKMSMANSVELRVPFLDRQLVEFALSIPESFKLRDGISKEPLKRLATSQLAASLEHPIPSAIGNSAKDVFYRQKTGFGAPIEDWFDSKLRKDLLNVINDDASDLEQYFDLQNVREMLSQGMITANRSYQIWLLYSFILWKKCYGL
jgi:asparagine synthase (glutamine-hydrolysing)